MANRHFILDIHMDFIKTIAVDADSYDEAVAKGREIMERGDFEMADFDPTGNYEVDVVEEELDDI